MDENFTKRPWHKTAGGIMVLSILTILVFVALAFAGFFVFYSVKIKFGDSDKLAKQFAPTQADSQKEKINLGPQVQGMQKYIRNFNPAFGAKDAKITVIEFIDFECQFCRQEYSIFKNVSQKYGPVMRVVFKNLPAKSSHPNAESSANAAACANEQGKFWQYYDLLFSTQKLDQESLIEHAQTLGLDTDAFSACLSETKFQSNIGQDMMDAASLRVKGTPTYFVNGYMIEGTPDEGAWDKIVLQLLNSK